MLSLLYETSINPICYLYYMKLVLILYIIGLLFLHGRRRPNPF